MKKNLLKVKSTLLVAVILMATVVSCEDSIEGDVNVDPIVATTIDPALLMTQVLVAGFSANRTVELNAMNMQSQHWSSIVGFGVFVNPERYTISGNTTNNVWVGHYTTVLSNLGQMRRLVEENNPEARNIVGQVRILEAFAYLNLTQIFGDIPFSQAIQVAEFPTPIFDTQEEVLRGIPALIDEGLAELATDTDIITTTDLIFGGDRQSWIRFGNTLKLKALMLVANVDPGSVQSQIQAVANEPLILDATQDATFFYTDAPGNENPIWKTLDQFAGGANLFWGSATTLVDIMNANNDPRRATFFDEVEGGGFVGQDQGVITPDGISPVSLNIIRPSMPDRYATASETNFYLAEAALQGWIAGGQAAANTFYRAGIQESLDFYDGQPGEIAQADKDAFMASARASIAADTPADALVKIHEEHWISDFARPIEGWTDWRRNKVPDFQLPVQAVLPDIIRRYNYPNSEVNANPNTPDLLPLEAPQWFEN